MRAGNGGVCYVSGARREVCCPKCRREGSASCSGLGAVRDRTLVDEISERAEPMRLKRAHSMCVLSGIQPPWYALFILFRDLGAVALAHEWSPCRIRSVMMPRVPPFGVPERFLGMGARPRKNSETMRRRRDCVFAGVWVGACVGVLVRGRAHVRLGVGECLRA